MKKVIAGILAAMVLMAAGAAGAAQVPPLINFQSVLYDDAGEPVPDGSSSVNFRITDINGSVLYEESQTLDVVHGMVSAMVGNGLTSGGAPTGGIPPDVFETDAGRYLDVTVDGYQPQATMEIVSVPYALYADKAMGAVDDSIGGDAIKAGAITARHFSDEALKELGGAMVGGDSLGVSGAAQSIGVRSGFSYSGSSNIQGVLTDLDRVMATRSAQMDTTINTLQTMDSNLQQQITNEVAERQSADGNLQGQIDNTNSRITDVEDRVTVIETGPGPNISALNGFFMGGKICAWGYANFESGGGSNNTALLYGSGASVSVASTTKATVTLDENCSGGRYMVLMNGYHTAFHTTGSDYHPALVSNRQPGSFDVSELNSPSTFDFMVIGEQ